MGQLDLLNMSFMIFFLRRNSARLKVLLVVKTYMKHLSVVQVEKPETFSFGFLEK